MFVDTAMESPLQMPTIAVYTPFAKLQARFSRWFSRKIPGTGPPLRIFSESDGGGQKKLAGFGHKTFAFPTTVRFMGWGGVATVPGAAEASSGRRDRLVGGLESGLRLTPCRRAVDWTSSIGRARNSTCFSNQEKEETEESRL